MNSRTTCAWRRSGPRDGDFFPFVFTLFLFILLGNLIGVFPYFFTFTSHIAVTLALTLVVVIMVTLVGLVHPQAALL